jgi:hypothetical protein
MDISSFLQFLSMLNDYGALQLPVLVLMVVANRKIQVYLKRQRYHELNLSAVNYSLEKNFNSEFTKPRDEFLQKQLEKEEFIASK